MELAFSLSLLQVRFMHFVYSDRVYTTNHQPCDSVPRQLAGDHMLVQVFKEHCEGILEKDGSWSKQLSAHLYGTLKYHATSHYN